MQMYGQKDKLSNTVLILMLAYVASILIFSFRDTLIYSQITFVVAFSMCLVYLARRGASFVFDTYLKLFLFFVLFSLMSALWAERPNESLTKVTTLAQLFVMAVMLVMYLTHSGNYEKMLFAVCIAGAITSVYIIAFYGFDGYTEMLTKGQRTGREIANTNTIGIELGTMAILSFFYVYSEKKLWMIPFLVMEVALVLSSGSRTATLFLAIGISVIVLVNNLEKLTIKKLMILVITAVVLILAYFWIRQSGMFEMVFHRFDTMFEQGAKKDNSTIIREGMRQAGWEYFLGHPLTGIGLNNTHLIAKRAVRFNGYLHNNYIEILAALGIIGFLLYYGMYAYILKNLFVIFRKTQDKAVMIIMIVLITRLAADYGTVSYYDKMNYIYLSIGAATVYLYGYLTKKKNGKPLRQVIKGS